MQIYAEIQPSDVYAKVLAIEASIAFMMYVMAIIILLVCCQLVAKLAIFKMIASMVKEYLDRTNRLLTIIEQHAQITDDQRDRVATRIDDVKDAVQKVPDKTVDKIKDVIPRPELPTGNGPSFSLWPFTASVVLLAAGITGANMPKHTNSSPQKRKVEKVASAEKVEHHKDAIKACDGSEAYESAMSLMRDRQYAPAYALFMKARFMSPTLLQDCTAKAAECCLYLDKFDDALTLCNELNTQSPKYGRAYLIRGLVYEAKGDKEIAVQCWFDAAAYGDTNAYNKLRTRRLV